MASRRLERTGIESQTTRPGTELARTVSRSRSRFLSHSLLRGGNETQGCVEVNEFEIEDRRKRLPLS